MNTLKYLLVFLGIGISSMSYAEYPNRIWWDHENYENEVTWLMAPPEDADSNEVFFMAVLYPADLIRPTKITETMSLRMKGDSIYLPIVSFIEPLTWKDEYGIYAHRYTTTQYDGWIKGVVEGEKIRFGNNSPVARVSTTITSTSTRYPDTIYVAQSQKELYCWGAHDFGEPYSYVNYTDTPDRGFGVSFRLTENDVCADFNRETTTLHNMDGGIFIGPSKTSYFEWYSTDWSDYPPFSQQLIAEILCGKLSTDEPTSLPTPKLEFTTQVRQDHHHGGDIYIYCYPKLDVRLNIVNPDGTIIDPSKLYFQICVDGKYYPPEPFSESGNPFYHASYPGISFDSYSYYGPYQESKMWQPTISGYCFYVKSNGEFVKSPTAYFNFPEGIDEIHDSEENASRQDNRIFDLTGREIKGEPSAPGIYIRNGRKFIIR